MKSLRLAALSIAALLAMGASAFADTQRITESTVMYDGPGTNYAVVGELATNTKVQVSTCQNGFCKVRHFWDEGWVIQDYLRADAPAPQPPEPQPPEPQPPQPQPPQPPFPGFPFPEPQPPYPDPQPPFPDYPQPQPPVYPQPQPPVYEDAGACFYSERNFGGSVLCLEEGESYSRLNRWNDRIRSVEVFGGARVDLCSDSNFYGSCMTLRDSATGLPYQLDRDVTSLEVY